MNRFFSISLLCASILYSSENICGELEHDLTKSPPFGLAYEKTLMGGKKLANCKNLIKDKNGAITYEMTYVNGQRNGGVVT